MIQRVAAGHYVIHGYQAKRHGRHDANRWHLYSPGSPATRWSMPVTTASNLVQLLAWIKRYESTTV